MVDAGGTKCSTHGIQAAGSLLAYPIGTRGPSRDARCDRSLCPGFSSGEVERRWAGRRGGQMAGRGEGQFALLKRLSAGAQDGACHGLLDDEPRHARGKGGCRVSGWKHNKTTRSRSRLHQTAFHVRLGRRPERCQLSCHRLSGSSLSGSVSPWAWGNSLLAHRQLSAWANYPAWRAIRCIEGHR
jgi:hypothetical protein